MTTDNKKNTSKKKPTKSLKKLTSAKKKPLKKTVVKKVKSASPKKKKTVVKKVKSTSPQKKKTVSLPKRKAIKGKKVKRNYNPSDDNIFAKSLPDWIISSHSKKRPKKSSSNKLFAFILLVSFIILFFIIKSSVFKRDDRSADLMVNEPVQVKKVSKVYNKKPLKKSVTTKKFIPAPIPIPAKPIKSITLSKKEGPYLVFVLDDVGNTKKDKQLLMDLGNNITYAILPFLPHSSYFADLSKRTKAEVLLHLPIESKRGNEKDPGKISPEMSRDQILNQLNKNFASVPFCVGANNHKGSLGTSDIRLMRIVLSEIKRRGLFFLDSYTTKDSVVSSISKQLGLPVLKRDTFLDNEDSPNKIDIQISKLSKSAREKGYAIGIGHYRYNTLKVLNKRIPLLKNQGYTIISLKQLINIIDSNR